MEGVLEEDAFHWASSSSDRVVRAGWSKALDGRIGVLVLCRPAKSNSWSSEMWAQWYDSVAALAARDTIRVVRAGGK